ncbi:MAG: hypothetical protein KDA66_03330 [Planctomycetaceae bacterium]|nr:hypothetical protein [Planctomycetaceae bacterium]
MKRAAACVFIAGYLCALVFGVFSHLTSFHAHDRLEMYFLVWDMYCGWDAYETRRHLIAEGESGTCYELTPAPWGDFAPYGSADRATYDYLGNHSGRLANNVLRHTEHEPIVCVHLVDECWPKKYNLPEAVWNKHYEEEQQRPAYYYLRASYDPDGGVINLNTDWKNYLITESIKDNPRLRTEYAVGQPFMPAVGQSQNSDNSPAFLQPSAGSAMTSR